VGAAGEACGSSEGGGKRGRKKVKGKAAAGEEEDLDALLAELQLTPGVCAHVGCSTKTMTQGVNCMHCRLRFCLHHGAPLTHGCGADAKASARAARFRK
jgi:hypothetical protein